MRTGRARPPRRVPEVLRAKEKGYRRIPLSVLRIEALVDVPNQEGAAVFEDFRVTPNGTTKDAEQLFRGQEARSRGTEPSASSSVSRPSKGTPTIAQK